jgi:hypothetical protein
MNLGKKWCMVIVLYFVWIGIGSGDQDILENERYIREENQRIATYLEDLKNQTVHAQMAAKGKEWLELKRVQRESAWKDVELANCSDRLAEVSIGLEIQKCQANFWKNVSKGLYPDLLLHLESIPNDRLSENFVHDVCRYIVQGHSFNFVKVEARPPFWLVVGSELEDQGFSLRLMKDRYWEPHETEIMRIVLDEGCRKYKRFVLDIGATFGYYSLYAATLGCKVVAYEPQLPLIKYLELSRGKYSIFEIYLMNDFFYFSKALNGIKPQDFVIRNKYVTKELGMQPIIRRIG